ncbi:SDR family NAD(P)-dependent oxidoreductase [Roseovarius sp. EL26]|uniref:SDR family NAD(P)-dependent oxidoreductase n=1 Tax=Roseovarius sp. EL26 TaxID=2126672 RepID=UPI000EA05E53|nr:SDR family NAD(P)-dependent oxidoreductase [Roseovarius sp. EL26]
MIGIAGKSVLVTGAYGGIGAAVAKAYAAAGAKVLCADLKNPTSTVEQITQAGGTAAGIQCDVADEVSVVEMMNQLQSHQGAVDVVVHCAGVIHERPLLDTPAAEFDKVIAVNLRGSFLVGQAAIRQMHSRSGRVILTSSDLGYSGRETFSPYVASKHGVMGLVRSWAKEFSPDIQVNALCPGPIDTEMLGAEQMTEKWRQKELDIPAARFGSAEEIAHMALFLGSDMASFITGQGVGINGGSVMP